MDRSFTRNSYCTEIVISDFDVCKTQFHKCSKNADCVDTDVLYTCHCKQGFYGDGFTCIGITICLFLVCFVCVICLFVVVC